MAWRCVPGLLTVKASKHWYPAELPGTQSIAVQSRLWLQCLRQSSTVLAKAGSSPTLPESFWIVHVTQSNIPQHLLVTTFHLYNTIVTTLLIDIQLTRPYTSDKGGKCFCPRSSVCPSVSKITQKRVHGLDKMLRVDRCRDMDELINFWLYSKTRAWIGWNVACRQMSGHGRTD